MPNSLQTIQAISLFEWLNSPCARKYPCPMAGKLELLSEGWEWMKGEALQGQRVNPLYRDSEDQSQVLLPGR
jgi:hypothetical protein